MNKGQSIIEIIVALGIFTIIASSVLVTVLGAFVSSRKAHEDAKALVYAGEGIEAVDSIRNISWQDITYGSYGLIQNAGQWELTGEFDEYGKFQRIVSIDPVERDLSGSISEQGDYVDENIKKITSSVTWNFTPQRQSSVELVSYVSDWQTAVNSTMSATAFIDTCLEVCVNQMYSYGNCRRNTQACSQNDEINATAGDEYCSQDQQADTCCCAQ